MRLRSFLNFSAVVTVLLVGVVSEAYSVMLLETPKTVVVRSIDDWDSLAHLYGVVDGGWFQAPDNLGKKDVFFNKESLCHGAGYSLGYEKQMARVVKLDHLCRADTEEELSFVFISDSQSSQLGHIQTGEFIRSLWKKDKSIRFVLHGGDAEETGFAIQWHEFYLVATTAYLDVLPIVAAVGNHEYAFDSDLANRSRLFSTPDNPKTYFALDYGVAAVIVLNSNVSKMSDHEMRTQTAWLESQLSLYQQKNEPVIVSFHHASFTSGFSHMFSPQVAKFVKANWQPLFEKYDVKLIMNGHEHIYERYLVNGITYITAGAAGGYLYPALEGLNPYSQMVHPKERTVTQVRVKDDGSILLLTYSVEDGVLIDKVTL